MGADLFYLADVFGLRVRPKRAEEKRVAVAKYAWSWRGHVVHANTRSEARSLLKERLGLSGGSLPPGVRVERAG